MTGKKAETVRLESANEKREAWKKWGPYLRERQLGTVRKDFSEDGNARECFHGDDGDGLGASRSDWVSRWISRRMRSFVS